MSKFKKFCFIICISSMLCICASCKREIGFQTSDTSGWLMEQVGSGQLSADEAAEVQAQLEALKDK